MSQTITRRNLLSAGAAAVTAPLLVKSSAPASTVAIRRCRSYQDFETELAKAFDQIGGIESFVRGKTVGLKLNLTGNPARFPLTPDLPYRTNHQTVAATVHLLSRQSGSFPLGAIWYRRSCHQQFGCESRLGECSESW